MHADVLQGKEAILCVQQLVITEQSPQNPSLPGNCRVVNG